MSLPGYIVARMGMLCRSPAVRANLTTQLFTPCLSTPRTYVFNSILLSVSVFSFHKIGLSAHRREARRARHHSFHLHCSIDRLLLALPEWIQKTLPALYSFTKRILHSCWEFMNPPLWAMLAAIIVASIPPLQHMFFDPGTFLSNSATRAISQSGGVAVPLILVVLGANLARNTLPEEDSHCITRQPHASAYGNNGTTSGTDSKICSGQHLGRPDFRHCLLPPHWGAQRIATSTNMSNQQCLHGSNAEIAAPELRHLDSPRLSFSSCWR